MFYVVVWCPDCFGEDYDGCFSGGSVTLWAKRGDHTKYVALDWEEIGKQDKYPHEPFSNLEEATAAAEEYTGTSLLDYRIEPDEDKAVKYWAEMADDDLIILDDETNELVGYLRGFDNQSIAADFMAMINEGKTPTATSLVGELAVEMDCENDDDHQYWFVVIWSEDARICDVEGLGYEDAFDLGEALIKQIKGHVRKAE